MEGTQFEKLLELLPQSDGTARKRLVSGGIMLIGVALLVPQISELVVLGENKLSLGDILTSLTPVLIVILVVYAAGSLVEMVGDYFVV